MLKKVYICSPLAGNIMQNIENVKLYTRYALNCGVAPVVPHFFALCLDDNIKEERELGLSAGLSLLWFCDELWVFGDQISQGMQKEIKFCENLNIPIKYIKLNKVYRKLGVLKNEIKN
jgi:hypothetical protein